MPLLTRPSLAVWDSDEVPTVTADHICMWNGFQEGDSIHSLQKYIERHDIELRNRYLEWVYDLSTKKVNNKNLIETFLLREGGSYWWMTNLIEQSVVKSHNITNIIKVFSLEKILKELSPKSVTLVSSNRELMPVIKELCESLDIQFVMSKQAKKAVSLSFINNLKGIFLESAKSAFAFFSYLKILIFSKKKNCIDWGQKSLFIVTYFANFCTERADKGEFYSYYWGKLHDLLVDMSLDVNWLHMYQDNISLPLKKAESLIERFDTRPLQSHGLLESYCTKGILLRAARRWLEIFNIRRRIGEPSIFFRPTGSDYSLWPLVKNDWNSSLIGSDAILNLFYFELFDSLLKNIPRQQAGLYLFENQSWERAFIYLWKKHGHGKLIGVAHTFVRFWDLRYFNDKRFFKLSGASLMPKPDAIVLNGQNAVNTYSESNTYSTFVECEALRYDLLLKLDRTVKNNIPSEYLNILVVAEYSRGLLDRMLSNIAKSIKTVDKSISLTVKPHPATTVTKIEHSGLKFDVVTDPLSEIVPRFDLVVTGSLTVASLDVFLLRKPLIVILDQKELNFSPLRGVKDVCFVSTVTELTEAIDALQFPYTAPDIESFFNIDNELPSWKKFLPKLLN